MCEFHLVNLTNSTNWRNIYLCAQVLFVLLLFLIILFSYKKQKKGAKLEPKMTKDFEDKPSFMTVNDFFEFEGYKQ